MQLPDIKALRELIKLLRSQGVLQYQSTDLNLVLSESLQIPNRKPRSEAEEFMDDEPQLTPEEEYERLLFYSADKPVEPQEQ